MRQNIGGSSRAVRVGNVVHVAGTTATVDGEVFGSTRPTASRVQVAALIEPRHPVKTEARARIPEGL